MENESPEHDIGLLDAIYTTRAIRKFRPDPVPLDLLTKVIEAATQAPSGRNSQPWHFVVVDDPDLKERIGALYRENYFFGDVPGRTPDNEKDASIYLANRFGEAPVLILVCARQRRGGTPGPRRLTLPTYAAVFPAVQNLLLAARAYGLGGVLTVNHEAATPAIQELLGIPEEMNVFAIVPMGFPRQKHGPKTRKPVGEVTSLNGWGRPLG